MAKRNVETFFATISQEGESGPVRGKIPAPLVAALGGKSGGGIEFEVRDGEIVGGRAVSPKEANAMRKQRDADRTPPKKATTPTKQKVKAKPVADPVPAKKKTKGGPVKSTKSNKRKTKVEYEEVESAPKKKKITFGKKKKK